jgi:hypothetical protein
LWKLESGLVFDIWEPVNMYKQVES